MKQGNIWKSLRKERVISKLKRAEKITPNVVNQGALRSKIVEFYTKNPRSFPWRTTKDPYRIMIAEFMLHRTRAEQVAPIYSGFIKKYPSLKALANAKEASINKVTEHLGLHWRSKHFIKSARFILKNYSGRYPSSRKELLLIPGVGDYVAGAILTVCFNKKEHVVDSNIARVLNRYYGLSLTGELRRKKVIIDYSRKLFNSQNPGKLLFAAIDFASLICKPRNPLCHVCILRVQCKSRNKYVRK